MAGPSKNKANRTGNGEQPWFKKRRSRARTKAKMVKNSKRKNRK